MKGLLRKDFYLLWRYFKFYLIIMAAVAGLAFADSIFLVYPILFTAMTVVGLTGVEEKSRWQLYTAALPCSRKTVVLEKYLFAALLLFPTTAICFLIAILTHFEPVIIFLNLCAAVLLLSLFLPVQLRFGVERARLFYLIIIVAVISGFSALSGIQEEGGLTLPQLPQFYPALIGLLTALAAGISILCAWRLYQNKELS